jgi:hypothetical protein
MGTLMKITTPLRVVALSVIISSCATPQPPQVFHKADNTALVIDSLDDNSCQVIQPTPLGKQQNDQVLTLAHKLPQHQTAVVILENYTEPQPGDQFRDRATPLFVGLRGAGYDHIVFLKGKGVKDPEGLIMLANYY